MTDGNAGWVRAHADDEEDWRQPDQSPIQQVDIAIHSHYLQQYLKPGMPRPGRACVGGGAETLAELAGTKQQAHPFRMGLL